MYVYEDGTRTRTTIQRTEASVHGTPALITTPCDTLCVLLRHTCRFNPGDTGEKVKYGLFTIKCEMY